MNELDLEIQCTYPRTGTNVYRMRVHNHTKCTGMHKYYEVWFTTDIIEKKFSNFLKMTYFEQLEKLEDYTENFYLNRIKEADFTSTEEGAFITNEEVFYESNRDNLIDRMDTIDRLVQTNISLPESLHGWVKTESVRSKKSLSEIIRLALDKYRAQSFICNRCGRKKHGLPFFEDDKRKHCQECFLKAFAEV